MSELLIDWLYQRSFGKEPVPAFHSNKRLRMLLTHARRFVLDDSMASFLADIDTAAFNKRSELVNMKAIDQMRLMARAPHSLSWVEFNFLAYTNRCQQIMNAVQYEPREDEQGLQEGWLIDNHPHYANMVRGFMFRRCTSPAGEIRLRWFPWGIYWSTDDAIVSGVPDKEGSLWAASVLLGIKLMGRDQSYNYLAPSLAPDVLTNVGTEAIVEKPDGTPAHYGYGTGCARRMWAFLSTINDIPVVGKPAVSLSRGFMARAQYRRFLSHKVLSLNVPQKIDRRRLARDIVAMSKRRAHMVRGHWRRDFRNPLAPLCEHSFETHGNILHCIHCDGQRLFIKEHQRGDASLGFVTHDYRVLH